MPNVIIIVGFGPGVSSAVAEHFGEKGFSVALVGRNEGRLNAGVEMLRAKGITAVAVPADASDPPDLSRALGKARGELGPIGVILWNASSGHGLGDVLKFTADDVASAFSLAISGLLSAVQETLPDLKSAPNGAVLVTNGAFGDRDPMIDAFAVAHGTAGVALGNAAKAKLVGLLAARLKDEGVFVGEVTVAGVVKGTGPDVVGIPTIEPAKVADAFWTLYKTRGDHRVRVS